MKKYLVMIFPFMFVSVVKAQTFLNGDFEINSAVGDQINLVNSSYDALMNNSAAFGTFNGGGAGGGDMDIITTSTYCGLAASGNWYVAMTSGGSDAFSLELSSPVIIGNSYTISFYDRSCPGQTPGEPVLIGVSTVNNGFGTLVYTAPAPIHNGIWTQRTCTFIAPFTASYITVTCGGAFSGSPWTQVDGFAFQNSTATIANFMASDTSFCDKQCLDFTDLSTNNPTSWQWSFPGAVPSTSTAQHPVNICYNAYGSFDVTLIACNGSGCDTLFIPAFITEYQLPPQPLIVQSHDTLYSTQAFLYAWYSTANPGTVLSTDPYYVTSAGGDYFVIISDSNSCQSSSAVFAATGIRDVLAKPGKFSVFPVPANNMITLHDNSFKGSGITAGCFLTVDGREIFKFTMSSQDISLPVEKLANGIYFIRLKTENEICSMKLSVQH